MFYFFIFIGIRQFGIGYRDFRHNILYKIFVYLSIIKNGEFYLIIL